MMSRCKIYLFYLIWFSAVSIAAQPAFGHYLWVIPGDNSYAVARGTIPDNLEAYNPSRVTLIKAYDRKGSEIAVNRKNEAERAVFQLSALPALAAVRCDWGGRVNTTQGKKLMTRKEAKEQGFRVLDAFFSTHTSKTIFADGLSVTKPVGMIFELVPVGNIGTKAPGDTFDIRLIFDGAPLVNAMVTAGGNLKVKTDQQGMAVITIAKTGLQVVMAKHVVPLSGNDEADYHQYMTFLVFQVKS